MGIPGRQAAALVVVLAPGFVTAADASPVGAVPPRRTGVSGLLTRTAVLSLVVFAGLAPVLRLAATPIRATRIHTTVPTGTLTAMPGPTAPATAPMAGLAPVPRLAPVATAVVPATATTIVIAIAVVILAGVGAVTPAMPVPVTATRPIAPTPPVPVLAVSVIPVVPAAVVAARVAGRVPSRAPLILLNVLAELVMD